jgi:hypothetical protein
MDDDVLRRGRPTCHVEFDEATALLVGDALQSLAFQLVGEYRLTDDMATQLEMVKILGAASGSRGMAGGQAIDLDSVGKALTVPELEFMHIHKTGALIRAAALLGARCGNGLGEGELGQVDAFAKCIGLAFQVVDDVLDAESSTATLGKTAGKDAMDNKPTYVSAMGLARARELDGFAEDQIRDPVGLLRRASDCQPPRSSHWSRVSMIGSAVGVDRRTSSYSRPRHMTSTEMVFRSTAERIKPTFPSGFIGLRVGMVVFCSSVLFHTQCPASDFSLHY